MYFVADDLLNGRKLTTRLRPLVVIALNFQVRTTPIFLASWSSASQPYEWQDGAPWVTPGGPRTVAPERRRRRDRSHRETSGWVVDRPTAVRSALYSGLLVGEDQL